MKSGLGEDGDLRNVRARAQRNADGGEDAVVEQALRNFRRSVNAWSEAALSRPRTVRHEVRHRSWRLAAGLALSAVLAAGTVAGGLHERHLQQQAQREQAAARAAAAQQRQQMAAQQARNADRDLLTKVDSDVSQEVPSAMEPLARLMDGSDSN